ncbi:PREDICTED: uncharacterized protein LOC108565835 isoform X2 [Nicrophorus vespilloides]|uniref:Uncharacterized protein LOC108565835 isoform X2 n=1 Tax=Nicrophorus vespilloides TaxID=110193 RepID=A0ABM1N2C2_NICVS|nr:PREDICTED: uncharacterized protein LOC108565835 isoform X2 [Nicrophorus vespilloides]
MKFDGTGPIEVYANLEVKTNIIHQNGDNYFQQVHRDIDITTDGILHMDLYKLYSGNTKISKIMNDVINDNSSYMFELLVPILENYFDSVLDKALNNFFETYTSDELLP